MTLKSDAKFEKNFGIWLNFNAKSIKSENMNFNVLLLSIAYKVSAKKYRRSISQDIERGSKLWRKIDFLFEKWHEELDEF